MKPKKPAKKKPKTSKRAFDALLDKAIGIVMPNPGSKHKN